MAKSVSKKLQQATSKIANLADFLLTEDGQNDWEIDEIHLTPKSLAADAGKVVCKYGKENGKWVLKCQRT